MKKSFTLQDLPQNERPISHFGNLAKIKEASIEELQKVKGIGFATACKLKASLKLGEKALENFERYGQKINSPQDVFNLLKNELIKTAF